ncbi:MAG TPA: DinB family protein, partial [Nocardioidaceae bacterium]
MIANDAERALLLAHLEGHRNHALGILDGLDEPTLRRAAVPSGWTCLGMIRHLTMDEERFWFRAVVAGDREAIAFFDGGPDTWQVGADETVADVLAAYRSEIERSNAIIAGTSLDAAPAWWPPDLFGDWRLNSLREIMLHMISEVACHAGHL